MYLYVALGDSITAGEDASPPSKSYPNLIVDELSKTGYKANGEILAAPGWTSRALQTAVLQNTAEPLVKASAITIWVGGDDLAFAALAIYRGGPKESVSRAIFNYTRDMRLLISSIRSVSRAKIIVCTQYNPFPNTPLACEAVSLLNSATAATVEQLRVKLAPAHEWFVGCEARFIEGYRTGSIQDVIRSPKLPIHPNNAGHRAIANGLLPYLI